MRDLRRITLVSRRRADAPHREWNICAKAARRIIFVGTFSVLNYALDHVSQDVDRILIDGTATPAEFLELLTTLPSAFLGDVLLMRDKDSSFLSSAGRADGRLLYSLTPADLQFYLETLGLVTRVAVAA
jgi:hypothetical protein